MVSALPVAKGANVQIGDMVSKAGIYTKPGVVVEKNDDGTVVIDTDTETFAQYHRHTTTNGLTEEQKNEFNRIMDDIVSNDDSADRINVLQAKIDDLNTDPENKKIVNSLRNEQASLIRISRELPRMFNYPAGKL